MPTTPDSPQTDLVIQKIEQLRKRLLDSSHRNPLIKTSFRTTSTNIIRFVDEVPDHLAKRLTGRGGQPKPMRLAALPPLDTPLPDEQTPAFLQALDTARQTDTQYHADKALLAMQPNPDTLEDDTAQTPDEALAAVERALADRVRASLALPERQTEDAPNLAIHAALHGIRPDYLLPTTADTTHTRHCDDAIQTLLLQERLTRVARSLHDKGHAFERETGVNVLHLAFGILRWQDATPNTGRSPAASPVLLLEVRMERKAGPQGPEFWITPTGEMHLNTTLAQVMLSDYGITLPPYTDTDTPTAYLEHLQTLAPTAWTWAVRNEALVGIFPSSRIAMYKDLDPTTRPIATHPVIQDLLITAKGSMASFGEIYETDAPQIEATVPHLVLDADASQFSTLVDVARGHDLAVEGPPGSGKSQTIVNLIAAAMEAGKSVLFVAEKLTALDVVRNRLTAIGLGPFVLPLQAGSGTREAVFDSLQERMDLTDTNPQIHATHAQTHQALLQRRDALQSYLGILGRPVGNTQKTVHTVMGETINTNTALDPLPRALKTLSIPDAHLMDPNAYTALIEQVQTLTQRLARAQDIAPFWQRVQQGPNRTETARHLAADLLDCLEGIDTWTQAIQDAGLDMLFPTPMVAVDAKAVARVLQTLHQPAPFDHALVTALVTRNHTQAGAAYLDAYHQAQEATTRLHSLFHTATPPSLTTLEAAIAFAKRHNNTLDPSALAQRVQDLHTTLQHLTRAVDVLDTVPDIWKHKPGLRLSTLPQDAQKLLAFPQAILTRRLPDDTGTLYTQSLEATQRLHRLQTDLTALKADLPLAGTHLARDIADAQIALQEAGLFRFLSPTYKAARAFFLQAGGRKSANAITAAQTLARYHAWALQRDAFCDTAAYKHAFGPLFQGMETDGTLLAALGAFHHTTARIAGADRRLRRLLETEPLDFLYDLAALSHLTDDTIQALHQTLDATTQTLDAALQDQETGRALHARFAQPGPITLNSLRHAHTLVTQVATSTHLMATSPVADLFAALAATNSPTNANSANDTTQDRRATDPRSRANTPTQEHPTHTPNHHAPTQTLLATLQASVDKATTLSVFPEPQKALALCDPNTLDTITAVFERHIARLTALDTQAQNLVTTLGIDIGTANRAIVFVHHHAAAIRQAAAQPDGLVERLRLLEAQHALQPFGLQPLLDWAQHPYHAEHRTQLVTMTRALWARSVMASIHDTVGPLLNKHDGLDLQHLKDQASQLDKDRIALSQAVIRDTLLTQDPPPEGIGKGRVSTYTQMSLINHELKKTRSFVSLRDLTARAGEALLALKPCWMMSPLAVAQYLQDGMTFDLVVIDEASQMTPENALGAVMRGKQIVVVGDTKQLPPTTFFQKILDDEDADEDTTEDAESILDMASKAFAKSRQLRWHYRSRHPDLIALSNQMVYNGNLTIFPTARADDPDLGVWLEEVNGVYKSGTNPAEAAAIVAGAIHHMRAYPHLSLGLATMNKTQAEAIIELFELERSKHPHVESYLAHWATHQSGLEEFFVKNLETIQGDERDVLMISTLYGPDPDSGKVHQRFGPINSQHGHRRLNVLFSRAKRKIITYTSLKPTDIQPDGKAYGVAMFRAWLEFSKTKRLHQTTRVHTKGTDSPFEDHVIAQIEAAGYLAEPQVGVSGFYIDIGVRHPSWPYGYILAVECDGAAYHSSRSSRDRDRLRQEILEGLGWRFHRIWSTDWYHHHQTQVNRLKAALDAALANTLAADAQAQATRVAVAQQQQALLDTAAETAPASPATDTAADTPNTDATTPPSDRTGTSKATQAATANTSLKQKERPAQRTPDLFDDNEAMQPSLFSHPTNAPTDEKG